MNKIMEIYFNDLNDEAKERYLQFVGTTDETDLNHEICPITIIELYEGEGVI